MRTITIIAVSVLWASAGHTQTLTSAQAKAHEGENGTVCGVVASIHTAATSKGVPTFINLDSSYPKEAFTILIWGDDRKNVGELPASGSHLCATGLIKDYRGVPEIEVKTKEQISR